MSTQCYFIFYTPMPFFFYGVTFSLVLITSLTYLIDFLRVYALEFSNPVPLVGTPVLMQIHYNRGLIGKFQPWLKRRKNNRTKRYPACTGSFHEWNRHERTEIEVSHEVYASQPASNSSEAQT